MGSTLSLHHSSIKLPTFCHSDRSRSASDGAGRNLLFSVPRHGPCGADTPVH
jgi:hypothetical protein